MHLRTSRKVVKSKIRARLVGRILGILYWAINVVYLIEESQIVVRYYFRYLLSQDTNTTTQIQVVEIVLSYLVIVIITILFALDAIVLFCITFRQEEFVETSYLYKLSEKEMVKDKTKSSCPCWHCMAKGHVKECPPAKPKLQAIEVKTVLLNLEKTKTKIRLTPPPLRKINRKLVSRYFRSLCRP